MKTTAGESTIGVNHVRSLLVVCVLALLLCHELRLGIAGQARGKFVTDLLRLWPKKVSALLIAVVVVVVVVAVVVVVVVVVEVVVVVVMVVVTVVVVIMVAASSAVVVQRRFSPVTQWQL